MYVVISSLEMANHGLTSLFLFVFRAALTNEN